MNCWNLRATARFKHFCTKNLKVSAISVRSIWRRAGRFFFDEDIRPGLIDDADYQLHGLILMKQQWEAISSRADFVPFVNDYLWLPCGPAQ
jgi:hypothetical protein